MNLPIRALYEIRAFSRPASRPDWRTCKSVEARMIREYENRKKAAEWEELVFGFRPLRLVMQANSCVWHNVPIDVPIEVMEAIPVRVLRGGGGNGD